MIAALLMSTVPFILGVLVGGWAVWHGLEGHKR